MVECAISKGIEYANQKNFEAAAEEFATATRLDPRCVDAWRNLGATLSRLGALPSERISCYEKALALQDDPYTHANLSAALLQAGEWQKAAKSAQRAVELLPNYFVGWLNLANALAFLSDLEAANQAYLMALRIEPNHPDVMHGYGALLQQAGHFEEAAAVLTKAQELFPQNHKIAILAIRARQQVVNWSRRVQDETDLKNLLQVDAEGVPPFNTLAFDGIAPLEIRHAGQLHSQNEFKGISAKHRIGVRISSRCRHSAPRVGYLTADLRDHVIGRLMGPVLQADVGRRHNIWIYDTFSKNSSNILRTALEKTGVCWRELRDYSWSEAAKTIVADKIDILIDMTGYTAHGRTGILAYRPAAIQVNFLGYPASFGDRHLADYVIADNVAVPIEHEAHFAEEVLRLNGSFLPPISVNDQLARSPSRQEVGLSENTIVLAAFHNGYKYTPQTLSIWVHLLQELPQTVLWLFAPTRQMQERFSVLIKDAGLKPERIVYYQGESYTDYLRALTLADLFLDTHPYGAGGTARDVLSVGLPMVTLLGDRMCGRMAASACVEQGIGECVVRSWTAYMEMVKLMVRDVDFRHSIREKLRDSCAKDRQRIAAYAQQLDNLYCKLMERNFVQLNKQSTSMNSEAMSLKRTFLHVGCGPKYKDQTTSGFNTEDWIEVRLDVDESVRPDVIGTMTDMVGVADASMDAVFSSHNIEHLYSHEVPRALNEFLRVMKDDGFLVLTCPDLQSVCALVAENKLTDVAYQAPAGPITPLDILYGYRPSLREGNTYMAHRCGFTERVLVATLRQSGFASVASMRRGAPFFDLWALATKCSTNENTLRELATNHMPLSVVVQT